MIPWKLFQFIERRRRKKHTRTECERRKSQRQWRSKLRAKSLASNALRLCCSSTGRDLKFYEFEGGISRLVLFNERKNLFFAQEITLSSCVLPNINTKSKKMHFGNTEEGRTGGEKQKKNPKTTSQQAHFLVARSLF
jgi:hypothetical protein